MEIGSMAAATTVSADVKAKGKNVGDEEFVKVNVQAFKEGKSMQWIAEKLGLSKAYVTQRRTQLRNRGVPLPALTRGNGGKTIDVDAYNKLIGELTGQSPQEIKKESKRLLDEAAKRKAERDADNSASS